MKSNKEYRFKENQKEQEFHDKFKEMFERMKSNKEYRFKENQKEQEFHDKFKEMFERDNMAKTTLSAIVFGWENDRQNYPKEYLTDKEEDICLNLIQWLGSPVGQGFLDSCGFVPKNDR